MSKTKKKSEYDTLRERVVGGPSSYAPNEATRRPTHSYRVSPGLYQAAREKALREGMSMSVVIQRLLEAWTGYKDTTPERADRGIPKPRPEETPPA